jgi:hypothetical protein
MRAKMFLLAAVLMAAAALGACSAQQPDWSIAVVGAEKTEFTSADYAKLGAVTVEATLKTKDGTMKTQKYEGVLLGDVIEYLGAAEYVSVTVEATDGYAKDYTSGIADDPLTILAVKADGQLLGDAGPVESVAGGQTGNMWIKSVSKITVNK